jgi:hypothetical protein
LAKAGIVVKDGKDGTTWSWVWLERHPTTRSVFRVLE